ncbi:MAG: four helix bundle protein [Candidatus Marinimicrobia bacterium]|nr:four helix bundle protein [Candidatus Neomarinimicrobiota bacterium]
MCVGLLRRNSCGANSIAHPDTSVGTEGFGRFEPKDKTRFYKISRGSTYELISQLLVSVALSYINEKTKCILVKSARNIAEGLNALIHSLSQRDSRGGILALSRNFGT